MLNTLFANMANYTVMPGTAEFTIVNTLVSAFFVAVIIVNSYIIAKNEIM